MEATEMTERIVTTEQRAKSNTKRIDKLELDQSAIMEMTKAVTKMATEMEYMRETQDIFSDRLKAIEQKPVARMEQVVSAVIVAVVGICIGYLFGGAM